VEDNRTVPYRDLVLVPALITLAVTILRLVGELQNWNPKLFSREAGGGGSLVGISWLVPLFGIYFAVRLVRAGFVPSSVWVTLGTALGALAVMVALGFLANALGLPPLASLFVFAAVSVAATWFAMRPWPALGRTLLAYALAARIPVAVLMLFAILGNWGTHYDVVPPDAATMNEWNPLLKWLTIGLLPQLTIWIWFTVVFGTIFGAIAAAVARRRSPATA
jgi:hypothetical protein